MQDVYGEKFRASLIAGFLFVALGGLGARLGYFHLANHSRVERPYTQKLLGLRGRIFDRNGALMAASLPMWRFFVDPQAVHPKHNKTFIINTVSDMLDVPRDEVAALFAKTNARNQALCVSTSQSAHKVLLCDPKNISGIGAKEVAVRIYPQGNRMAHLIGFVNWEGVGVAGVEQRQESNLKGVPGWRSGEVNANGKVIGGRSEMYTPAIPGNDVSLTLDNNIQYVVEQALKEVVETFQAASAWAIVQDVRTGAILAMATDPNFNPGNHTDVSTEAWRNHAVSVVYEPGSIMKAMIVAAALKEKLVTPDTAMDAENGVFMYMGKPLHDHVTGWMTVATALAKSSNIICAKIGLILGPQRMHTYLQDFGFGNPLGIELPGEEKGLLGNWKTWDKLTWSRVPIGQGVAVTGLQMVNAYSAIANGGKLMRPYVIDRVVSPTGEVIHQGMPEIIGEPIPPEVARAVREMLLGVTEEGGTGKRADVKGYTVAGKTGTAQHAVRGGYSTIDYFASFVGFVPARNPVFCVLVTVDRPRPQHMGGYVAAPVFQKIATFTARYLEVPPDVPNEKGFE
ncbi:MAG: penicillin-binding protein 2 [Kiritimatiellaeota bacterium]|nr:penicillin-binding protein 2 [Kiritimatiellota bacterium]